MFHRQHLPLVLLQKTMDVLQYVLIILYLYFKYDNISDYMSFQYLFLLLWDKLSINVTCNVNVLSIVWLRLVSFYFTIWPCDHDMAKYMHVTILSYSKCESILLKCFIPYLTEANMHGTRYSDRSTTSFQSGIKDHFLQAWDV